MREICDLFLNGGNDLWVTVTRVAHCDASTKIDISISVNIPHFGIFRLCNVGGIHIAHATSESGCFPVL
jgi:hypothetical protein